MRLSELLCSAGMEKQWNNLKNRNFDPEITLVTNDSRKCKAGAFYVSTVNEPDCGKLYLQDALEKGAVCFGVKTAFLNHLSLIFSNPRKAYSYLAAAFHGNPHHKLCCIGITGTNGKTSTAWMIGEILRKTGHKIGVLGTVSNALPSTNYTVHQTTANSEELFYLMAKMVEEGCTHCVMEVSSHGLWEDRVAPIHFQIGVFTNLTQDHLDYHFDMENYFLAKCKLFTQSEIGIINQDTPYGKRLLKAFPDSISYSFLAENSRAYGCNMHCSIRQTTFLLELSGQYTVALPLIGGYNGYNALAALTTTWLLGIPLEDGIKVLGDFSGVPGRVELLHQGDFTIVRDYAHTPDALEKLLKALYPLVQGRLLTLFGCGGDRDRSKRPLMGKVAQENSHEIILTSDNPRSEEMMEIIRDIKAGIHEEKGKVTIIPNRRLAISYGVNELHSGDLLVLAGKGHEVTQILKDKIIPFDEKEIVKELLQ